MIPSALVERYLQAKGWVFHERLWYSPDRERTALPSEIDPSTSYACRGGLTPEEWIEVGQCSDAEHILERASRETEANVKSALRQVARNCLARAGISAERWAHAAAKSNS